MGIYINLMKTNERHKAGHRVYKAECRVCGKQVRGRRQDLCAIVVCKHVYKGTDVPIMRFQDSRIGGIFYNMMARCYDPSCKDYGRYGGRGITVCDEWQRQQGAFETWYEQQKALVDQHSAS